MINLYLQIYVDTPDDKNASEISSSLLEKLKPLCQCKLFKLEQYWKIPEYFLIAIDISVDHIDEIELITDFLGKGWREKINEYLWSPSSTATFICSEAKWAQLELIE